MSHQLEQLEPEIVDDEKPVSAEREIAGRSPLQIAFGRLLHDKVAMVSLAIVIFFALIAILVGFMVGRAVHVGSREPRDFLQGSGLLE